MCFDRIQQIMRTRALIHSTYYIAYTQLYVRTPSFFPATTMSPANRQPASSLGTSTATNIPDLYAASVNPPRRAKRSLHPTSLSADFPNPKNPRTLLPTPLADESAPAAKTHDTNLTGEPVDLTVEQASAVAVPPAPKKRGRKPLGGSSAPSRAARESARRANHSRIEKARRLKINGALETLRVLVPAEPELGDNAQQLASLDSCDADVGVDGESHGCECVVIAFVMWCPLRSAKLTNLSLLYHSSEDVATEWVNWKDGHEDGNGTAMTGKSSAAANSSGNARAFKLDVLERTVVYVRVLLDRIRQLEAQLDATDADAARACTCGAFSRVKRKSKAIINKDSESNLLGEIKRRKLSASSKISSRLSYGGDELEEEEGELEDMDYHDHSDSEDNDDNGVNHPSSSSSPLVAYQNAKSRSSRDSNVHVVEHSDLGRRPHLPSIATLLAEPLTGPAHGYKYSAARTEHLVRTMLA